MAVDLTKLSDSDLHALQSNDLSKVSDDGLYELSGNAHPGFGQTMKATGDVIASGLSHALVQPAAEGIGGIAAALSGHDAADWRRRASDIATYNTQTPQGQHLTAQISNFLSPATSGAGRVVHNADDFVGKYGGPEAQRIVRQAAGTATDILGVIPGVGVIAKGARELGAAARPIEDAATVARTPDELAAAGGYTVPPSQLAATTGVAQQPSGLQKVLEAVGDRPTIRRADIINAKAQTNNLVRQANNIPADQLLSESSLKAAEAPHAAVYRAAEQAIPDAIALDPAAVAQAGAREGSLRPIPAAVEKERAGAAAITQANGKQLMETISDYRAKGYKGLASEDVDQQAVGKAQLDIANALESQMKDHLDAVNPGLAEQFQQARTGFAKINDARAALVGHDIDPVIMRRLADNNPGISGEYRYIADMAERFPKIMTIKVPGLGANVLGHGVGMGLLGSAGWHLGGTLGMGAGMAAAPILQAGARRVLDATRTVATNPRVALQTALADYVRTKGAPFNAAQAIPEQQTAAWQDRALAERMGIGEQGRAEVPPTARGLSLIPGRDYSAPTRLPNEGLNPPDHALAMEVASRHPSVPRPAPLRLPAPGQLADRPASGGHVPPAAALQHPASPNVSSTVTQQAERDRIAHMVQVLAARRAAARSLR